MTQIFKIDKNGSHIRILHPQINLHGHFQLYFHFQNLAILGRFLAKIAKI